VGHVRGGLTDKGFDKINGVEIVCENHGGLSS